MTRRITGRLGPLLVIFLVLFLMNSQTVAAESAMLQEMQDSKDVADFLLAPLTPDEFFATKWDRTFAHLRVQDADKDGGGVNDDAGSLSRFLPIMSLDTLLHHYAPLFLAQDKTDFIDVRVNGKNLPDIAPHTMTATNLSALVQEGKSLIFRLEHLDLPSSDPAARLTMAISDIFGLTASLHGYVSGPDQSALNPHSDPYDVFVLQLSGSKDWTVCLSFCKCKMGAS